jgi:hypothetical protein
VAPAEQVKIQSTPVGTTLELSPAAAGEPTSRPLADSLPKDAQGRLHPLNFNPPAGVEQWTHTWTNVGCDVGWGQICEGEVTFAIPKQINGVSKNLEYCSHTAQPNPQVHSWWRETDLNMSGVKVWMKSVGGPPWDQYGASIKFGVVIRSVSSGLSNEVRKQLGCQSPNTGKTQIAACVLAGSGQKQAITNCLKGESFPVCAQFSDLKATRCVKDQSEATWFFNNQCSNEIVYRYDYIHLTSTKLCR